MTKNCMHDLSDYPPFRSGGLIDHGLTSHQWNPDEGTATIRCKHGLRWHWDGDEWHPARLWQPRHIKWLVKEIRDELSKIPREGVIGLSSATVATVSAVVALARGIWEAPSLVIWIGAPALVAVVCVRKIKEAPDA